MIMKRTVLLAAACALMAAPAFAQSGTMQNNSTRNKAMQSSGASGMETQGAAPSGKPALSADEFVKKAAITNIFEIQAAQLAEEKSKQKEDQQFAKQMIDDHTKAGDELKSLVDSGKVQAQIPTALDSQHRQKLAELKKLRGEKFDKAYDQANKKGHRQAVAMFQNYAKNGDNADLKQWAQKTLPTLKEHLSMATKLQ